jgi:branched-subunit amino acid ABC-type transport system permease component
MVGAYVFYELRFNEGFSFALSVVLALLVMRPPRRRSPLARLIATLGILTTIEGIARSFTRRT